MELIETQGKQTIRTFHPTVEPNNSISLSYDLKKLRFHADNLSFIDFQFHSCINIHTQLTELLDIIIECFVCVRLGSV